MIGASLSLIAALRTNQTVNETINVSSTELRNQTVNVNMSAIVLTLYTYNVSSEVRSAVSRLERSSQLNRVVVRTCRQIETVEIADETTESLP
eukprot:2276597-Amphidinium_carterae.1